MSKATGQVAIRVEGLGKRYSLGTGRQGSTIIDRLSRMLGGENRNPFSDATIWAIRGISFEIPRGQVVGLLGRNGSGKTTLVRLLARVSTPTEGRAMVNGRVGALFQAGAGFHPELSGRENVWLSGAVLGMSREAVAAVFDRIVEFSEVGEYLDAPVKHYSSGMYQRLAFSVAAHLEAEIMLIDEALSVGDLRFQEKCQDHMRTMVGMGRTVLYVSHSLETVRQVCDAAMVLDAGELRFTGSVDEAITSYVEISRSSAGMPVRQTNPAR